MAVKANQMPRRDNATAARRGKQGVALFPLVKMCPSDQRGTSHPVQLDLKIGTACPPSLFPATHGDVVCLTLEQLDRLSRFYNDRFEIEEHHSLAERRQLFYRFVCDSR